MPVTFDLFDLSAACLIVGLLAFAAGDFRGYRKGFRDALPEHRRPDA